PADGYTLLIASATGLAMAPHVPATAKYNPLKDLTPITRLVNHDSILVVHPSFPAKNLKEFIALVKKEPRKYSYATGGLETNLAGELLKSKIGLSIEHIPYKGAGAAVADVIGGHVPIMVSSLASIS